MMRRDRKKKIDERECHGAAYTIGKWELGAYIVGLIWDFVLGFIREGQVLEKRSGKSGYRSLLDSLTFTPKFLLFFTVYTLFFGVGRLAGISCHCSGALSENTYYDDCRRDRMISRFHHHVHYDLVIRIIWADIFNQMTQHGHRYPLTLMTRTLSK